ncbi:Formimidoyltetrahydrofolate cyclodeaminase [Thermanaerovibrio acidaminovorans DSM 6589]|jgi:glutamate formiminotransferase/formiminotetrahydrofolate cyclodeaminase|uniref:Formimidoyltetrahydrofolate cyclodeaminase n=1 Tax=Thermanaerovibrio acidaminovorans (strain ATCC 49978 / DSM 6589 / Su883) TaxID=525903 RepID=D1BA42_THEAS|nr:cyclodeaminase/cyclohydrolase family protein [Thermanaerovibrio acidaminovorans]ACZ19145.1 Formimidoyltetrahydrofolate cyclodeaminase [Thermanaerovibrio acidaminovorans DSM 6589]
MKLQDMTVASFVAELASDSPAPGGGSVAALCGALGGALSAMVATLTVGKEKYKDSWEVMERVAEDARGLYGRFLDLMEEDTEAFNAFMAARRMPKETPEEKALRAKAMDEASRRTALVPLNTLRLCSQLVQVAAEAAKFGNPNAVTDAGTAALLARGAAKAAAYNVFINLPGMDDQEFVESCKREVREILDKVERGAKEVEDLLSQRLGL